jgi:hypothetical protein
VRTITGFGEISATILLAELPNVADFAPKALAAFHRRSPAAARPASPHAGSGWYGPARAS